MTWGFVVCGPNEALVVSGEKEEENQSQSQFPICPIHRMLPHEAFAGARRESFRLARDPVRPEVRRNSCFNRKES